MKFLLRSPLNRKPEIHLLQLKFYTAVDFNYSIKFGKKVLSSTPYAEI